MRINMLFTMIFVFVIGHQTNGVPISKDVSSNQNKLEQNRALYQGDIVLPLSSKSTSRGVLVRGNTVAWPKGVVPYVILPGYGSSQVSFIINTMQKMERAIAINNIACIQFRDRIASNPYYISIVNDDGCYSSLGQNTGEIMNRTVSLNYPGCFAEGRIMHELLHTLGFLHEQSRPDRDNYVKVHYENIQAGMEDQFEKYDNTQVDTQNTSYDYASVMHYPADAFSQNGLPTIEPLQPNVTIGQRYNMSTLDILKVRLFYNCSSNGITLPTIPTTTTANLYKMNTSISSSLTSSSDRYVRYEGLNASYYYEAFAVTVPTAGYYIFQSNSSIDTYGYLYSSIFVPNVTYLNLVQLDDDSGGNRQFQFQVNLQPNQRYILVATTYNSLITGNYTVLAFGLARVDLVRLNISTIMAMTTTPASSSTTSNAIITTYSSALTSSSPMFDRYGSSGTYYYQSIIITVTTSGLYTLQSTSAVDTFGYLYLNSFDPSNIVQNLLDLDDDSGVNNQFAIQFQLQSGSTYILIATTYHENVTTSFTISASGPNRVTFNRMTTTSANTVPTSQSTSTSTAPPIISSASRKFNILISYLLTYTIVGDILNHYI